MSETRSQFTYSPEGILDITTGLDEEFGGDTTPEIVTAMTKHRQEHLESLNSEPGITVEEANGIANIKVEIAKRFDDNFNNQGGSDITDFLSHLYQILPMYPQDLIDRVVSLEFLGERGATGVINQHFQRWLNVQGITEDVARHSVLAMASPFGKDKIQQAKKDFRYSSGDWGENTNSWHFTVNANKEKFGVVNTEDTPEAHLEIEGEVEWRWVNMKTLGDCACWGVAGEDRMRLRTRLDTRKLYEMHPHNVDYARQSLSLVLGMGALTYYAAQYKGNEDIFAETRWKEPRIYPKM